ncbi:MAG TPA: glycosyltransferase family A protein [Allosphingosinicella sp.]|jgi:glycosyltransferase involved in cell wall biosynthesis
MSLVSVVMPVLDAAAWLGEAIGSILAQTHRALELIVVDDGSSDDSRAIAAAAAAQDERVRTLFLPRLESSTSSARAANAGVGIAKGLYIARMDADDVALPHRIEREVAFLEARGLDACGGLASAFGGKGRLYWYPETGDGIDRELLFRVGILHPTLLARAGLMRAHPYLERASHEDYEWQIRVSAAGARLGNVQEVVLNHREHPGQAHVRHVSLFLRDLRRYRFRHLMRLFPGTKPGDYQIFAAIAEKADITDRADLARAAAWLARLARVEEAEIRPAMAYRWEQVCKRASLAAGDPLRELFPVALASTGDGEADPLSRLRA